MEERYDLAVFWSQNKYFSECQERNSPYKGQEGKKNANVPYVSLSPTQHNIIPQCGTGPSNDATTGSFTCSAPDSQHALSKHQTFLGMLPLIASDLMF
jgi:hypothetical protein